MSVLNTTIILTYTLSLMIYHLLCYQPLCPAVYPLQPATITGPNKAKESAPKAMKKANKTTTPLGTNSNDFQVLGSSQLSYNPLVREDYESGEVMVHLQPKHKRILKKKRAVA